MNKIPKACLPSLTELPTSDSALALQKNSEDDVYHVSDLMSKTESEPNAGRICLSEHTTGSG